MTLREYAMQASVLRRLLSKCGEAGLSIDGVGALQGVDQVSPAYYIPVATELSMLPYTSRD